MEIIAVTLVLVMSLIILHVIRIMSDDNDYDKNIRWAMIMTTIKTIGRMMIITTIITSDEW